MPAEAPNIFSGVSAFFGGLFGGFSIVSIILGLAIAVALAFILFGRGGGGGGGGSPPGKGDLLVLEYDEDSGEIVERMFTRIGASSYVYTGPDGPKFLEITPGTRIYKCRKGKKIVPCVPAYPRDILAIPFDPALAAATSLLLARDDMVEIASESDAVKLLKALYDRMEDKQGKVVLEGPTRVLFSFNLKRILTGVMDIFAVEGATFIKHFLSSAANVAMLERLYRALGEMVERRYRWIQYAAVGVVAVGLAIGLASMFLKGAPPPPPR